MSISSEAVTVVNDAQSEMEGEIRNLNADASAGDILEATVNINQQTNLSSAAISTSQREIQTQEQAIASLRR